MDILIIKNPEDKVKVINDWCTICWDWFDKILNCTDNQRDNNYTDRLKSKWSQIYINNLFK